MSDEKEMKQLQKLAEKQGWVVTMTSKNHTKWMSPFGGIVISSSTPSDRRTLTHLKRDLRVNGFIEIKKGKGRRK